MSLVEDFLKQVGESGFPKIADPSIKDTWELYEQTAPELRVYAVLGFLHLVHQAGMGRLIQPKIKPTVFYKQMLQEEFAESVKAITRQLAKYRVFDALHLFKSKFSLNPIRGGSRVFRFDLCLTPKRSRDHLDSALAKLQGMLYTGDLPKQFQEVWKKGAVKSNAKPKSSLGKASALMANESTIGWLPLIANPTFSMFARRAADDCLLLRIQQTVPVQSVPWLRERQHDDLLKTVLRQAFSKLKG